MWSKNAAAELQTKLHPKDLVIQILISCHWLCIKFIIQFKVPVITYRALHGQTWNHQQISKVV